MLSTLKLTQHLSTKISHDLAGVLGAIKNSAELVTDPNEHIRSQSIDLMHNSINKAIYLLEFFREAYGITNFEGEISLNEIKKLACNLFSGLQIKISFQITDYLSNNNLVNAKTGKLILCLLFINYAYLIQGGEISVEINYKEKTIKISVNSYKEIKINHQKLNILLSNTLDTSISVENAHVFYTRELKESADLELNITTTSHSITYFIN